jgi:transcriptional regulator with XRE-family HTH domain
MGRYAGCVVADKGKEKGVPAKSRNAIGPRIRELRLERGLTLDELARSASISASHLSRLERGQTAPSFTVAAAIAREIGVMPSDLVAIQREQSSVDDALVGALVELGLEEETALHICDGISTRARLALLTALHEKLGLTTALELDRNGLVAAGKQDGT